MALRVELVGGPYCGRWWPMDALPAGRFGVTGRDLEPCIYEIETDEADDEHRATFVEYLRVPS